MAHRLQKALIALTAGAAVILTSGAIAVSAADMPVATLNRFIITESGNRVLTGSVAADSITQDGWYVANDDSLYYYYSDGSFAQEETTLADGFTYVFAADGALETGWQTVNGIRYYYHEETGQPVFGWISYLGDRYYIDKTAGKLSGEQTIDGTRYLFDEYGAVQTGWITFSDGKLFYYSEDAVMMTGWMTQDSATYYLTPDGAATGWQTIGEKTYYFSAAGEMQTGWQVISDRNYYFGSDGTMQTGWQTISGNHYYFDTNGTMQTGWITVNNAKYYLGTDGKMRTGFQTISDRKYYFGADGTMQTGWQTISGNRYYFGSDGTMQTGWLTIDGAKYYLGTDGKVRTGLQTISGSKYYFGTNGTMQTGWITTGGSSYYFDPSTGAMINNGYAPVQLNNVPDYKQFDEAWANKTITYSTIGKVGCLVTSIAMKYSYESHNRVEPDEILSLLTFSGDSLQWVSFSDLGYTMEQPSSALTQSVMRKIYTQLSAGKPVIVGAKNSSGGQHYVVVTGYTGSSDSTFSSSKFVINDPGSSTRDTLDELFAVYSSLYMIVY